MYELNELKERVMEELIEFGRKGSFSRNELPTIDLLAHTAKNLCKVIEMCEEKTGYSYGMRTNMRGNYNYSGARRRDSMGRYSADDDWMMETLHELNGDDLRRKCHDRAIVILMGSDQGKLFENERGLGLSQKIQNGVRRYQLCQ